MKYPTAVKKKLIQFFVAACLLVIPAISFCQAPPGPGDDNPDVPFDKNMNLVFLAVGIVFAVVIIARKLRKNAVSKY